MRYRRPWVRGGCYFFTIVAHRRRRVLTGDDVRPLLAEAMREVRWRHPFRTEAMVLLPDHLHCVWTLPPDDADFATRWSLIKRAVTVRAGIGRVWQARFWEHLVRDEEDFRHHVEYVHFNPVKHGLVSAPIDWAWSSFHRYVREGVYPPDWGETEPALPEHVGCE